ncbi:class A beta-lactamase-related serine hydrolase [Aquirhabdus parva]|uniref:Class A beta-lactamase-related serine hydrolase n=2 Tax=Aquirhabdus parva TaxID=2283318 RepID=A0A345PBR9_9GAMM|nr:class A beta-lactamase-related serine hydrolase [Aquirhabdus parva]
MIDQSPASAFLIRRRRFLAAGLAAVTLPAFGKVTDVHASSDELDAFIRGEMSRANIPGMAVGIARKGEVRLTRGYGFAEIEHRRAVTVDTLFHIASVTKTVTATAVMRLAESGKFHLDDSVAGHLDFPLINPHHPDAPITFRQLLMHTSSISDAKYYDIDFRQHGRDSTVLLGDFLKDYLVAGGRNYAAEGCFSKVVPGGAWDYSNVGYGLLGYLASRIGGEDMREQTRKQIFAPLGMRHSSWTIAGTSEARRATPYDLVDGVLKPMEMVGFPDWSAGMLRSSVAEFTRFVAASANGGSTRQVQILGKAAMAEMLDMRTPPELPTWLTGQGLGWGASNLAGKPFPNHWGGDPGVFTAVYLDPASQSGVVIFTNMSVTAESRTAVKNIANRLLTSQVG